MPSKNIHTEIEGRKLKLSNPSKVLYPDSGILKAEVVKYYLEVAPFMLPHITGRPLTMIRFPDGIQGKRFYSKNKPSWTPSWIASTLFPEDEDNQYVMATEKATLAWIANLAGLEIHPMNVRSPNLLFPDQFIFDLDPSSEVDFPALKELSFNLKIFLENHGYNPFIKTSGSKGLHIYVPLLPEHPTEVVYQSIKKLAGEYVKSHDKYTTLKISKEKRKGKVLLDIYRNSKAQSCAAVYSLRGKPGAPISTPFHWDLLEGLESSQKWNINNISKYLNENGDPWKAFTSQATMLHDKRKIHSVSLNDYDQKRDFDKTTEPISADNIITKGNEYVVQLHDASNLHYDLRLEENGILLSWAIPKGLPEKPKVKRLAVRTEDHPLKYLQFEGKIPKHEYGGGEMWIFDHGVYSILKKSEKKIHFKLEKGGLRGEYVLYHTKDKQWIIENKSSYKEIFPEINSPMLATLATKMPSSDNFLYEIKWDGIRAIFYINHGTLTIYSRNGNDITTQFPKLQKILDVVEAETAVLDGEIVHLDEKGRPLFHKIVGRIHSKGEINIAKSSQIIPATVYLFDLLYLDGKDCRTDPCHRRRSWLATILKSNNTIRYSESFEDGVQLLEAIKVQSMEGIMCKKRNSPYLNGSRSSHWKKIKVRHEDTAYIIGYTAGEGDRAGSIGALHLAKKEKNKWVYKGKVGTGFSMKLLRNINLKLTAVTPSVKIITEKIDEAHRTKWISPDYLCEINYASMSSNNTYREPVFQKMWKA